MQTTIGLCSEKPVNLYVIISESDGILLDQYYDFLVVHDTEKTCGQICLLGSAVHNYFEWKFHASEFQ